MSSEKQIAANRDNAKRSTGPRTLAGKSRSRLNAFRHGLSRPLHQDKTTRAKVEVISAALAGESANVEQQLAARQLAKAQLQLLRIRAHRADLAAGPSDFSDPLKLRRLASLDRYERIALTKQRRAGEQLDECGAAPLR